MEWSKQCIINRFVTWLMVETARQVAQLCRWAQLRPCAKNSEAAATSRSLAMKYIEVVSHHVSANRPWIPLIPAIQSDDQCAVYFSSCPTQPVPFHATHFYLRFPLILLGTNFIRTVQLTFLQRHLTSGIILADVIISARLLLPGPTVRV